MVGVCRPAVVVSRISLLSLLLLMVAPAGAAEAPLPVEGSADKPLVLLQAEASAGPERAGVVALPGEVVAKEGVDFVAVEKEQVVAAHKGQGNWGVSFRYTLGGNVAPGEYTFWARWMQGGEPSVSAQKFVVLAGASADALEERGSFQITNDWPWKHQWVMAKTLELKAGDAVVEVRNSGRGQDAKAFDAFLLSPGKAAAPAPVKAVGDVTKADATGQRTPLELPIKPTDTYPLILLQLGSLPPLDASTAGATAVYAGDVADHEGDRAIEVGREEVTSQRAGSGAWRTNFRFDLPEGHPAGKLTFWARWKQGGDPNVSKQRFEVFAGADEATLDKRGSMELTPAGWNYTWATGSEITIKPEDRVLEVRNSGNGDTAKIFNTFILGGPKPPPPAVELPMKPSAEKPVAVLGFGKVPLNIREPGPGVIIHRGKMTARPGSEAGDANGEAALVIHKGFGEWGATFLFDVSSNPIPPGFYNFNARYMTGGEASQVKQTFVVKAGPDPQSLAVRGTFSTTNRVAFKQQWVADQGMVTIFPGDKFIQIENSGKADGAKVFSAFALGQQQAMPAWLTAEQAAARTTFLARTKTVARPQQTLYVVDGPDAGGDVLFAGLAADSAKEFFESSKVNYLIGDAAEQMARKLNLPSTPAAVIVNTDRRVLGVLAKPSDASAVTQFLQNPEKAGMIPAHPEVEAPAAQPLVSGSPAQWLIGTGWPGQNGVARWGIDAEATQRPNPGDLIAYSYYTSGDRSGHWEARPAGENGVCVLVDRLPESYAWGKATNYAVVYLKADAPVEAQLRLQHSGMRSSVFLDGSEASLQNDPAPIHAMIRRDKPVQEGPVERGGQEIHTDVAVPASAEAPRIAPLKLTGQWQCLVIKMVQGQAKNDRVLFSALLTGADGKPLTNVQTTSADPTVPLAQAATAAGLWPTLKLENIPGNLPHPGEPLTLVADMRVTPSFLSKWSPEVFLPVNATLRVRMSDYDGKEIKVFETRGSFPGVAKIDLGPAPAPGFYSLTAEMVKDDGQLIHRFYPDGFSVVLGNAAQKERVDKKELMNSWYYAFDDWETLAPWLERTGMLKNVGSFPGGGPKARERWEDAKKRGIIAFADFAGDSAWMNNSEKDAKAVVETAAPYTRYFKSINEVDGRFGGDEGVSWNVSRNPEKYVERTKWQHDAVHAARADAINFGGSVYTSGNGRTRSDHPEILGPRQWLRKCLELGLDNYIDVWDVHAYPQFPPRLEAESVTNAATESDMGVRSVYKEAGIEFKKPFLLGETSAMAFHGYTGVSWQAETLAKMTAWTNSREDWIGIALCAAHHDRRQTAEEYGIARCPGEAAVYTAGALIDGLPYKRVPSDDKGIQAAYFGPTFMVWRDDDKTGNYTIKLDAGQQWLLVDVVGRTRPLPVSDGSATFEIGTRPQYVIPVAEYERLTRMQ